ncbi:MAG TPA: hypothetical protein VIG73_08230 [Cerasibacillus sp.]|uniref:hypothetical protein n=1 Tax=Cerasibacillus sp. TaxID=2498711 RepID=UPI002F420119
MSKLIHANGVMVHLRIIVKNHFVVKIVSIGGISNMYSEETDHRYHGEYYVEMTSHVRNVVGKVDLLTNMELLILVHVD